MVARAMCWLAFGVHAVSLGMACLAMQIIIVSLTLVCSVAAVQGWEIENRQDDKTYVGNRLVVSSYHLPGEDFRAKVYAQLGLGADEEQNMVEWDSMPQRSNSIWWGAFERYRDRLVETQRKGADAAKWDVGILNSWGDRLAEAYKNAEMVSVL